MKWQFFLSLLTIFFFSFLSCYRNNAIKGKEERCACVEKFVIINPKTTRPDAVGFKILTFSDTLLHKLLFDEKFDKIQFKGNFFNDTTFSGAKMINKDLKDSVNFVIMSLHTCYFFDKSREKKKLDSIAKSALEELTITVTKNNQIWEIKKCK